MDSVTSGVGHGEDLVVGAGNEIALTVPVSARHLLAVLGDAWNLTLVLAVVENDATLVRADGKDGSDA